MASEPPEDAIANFVSFTSTTREQAINFLKVNDTLLDLMNCSKTNSLSLTGQQPRLPESHQCLFRRPDGSPSTGNAPEHYSVEVGTGR